jgi:hypothetical protein
MLLIHSILVTLLTSQLPIYWLKAFALENIYCISVTSSNEITFNFSESIRDGSFTIDDIGIVHGTIDSGSFTKVSETQYTIRVTPSLGGEHSNVAITVAANTFTNIAGNANTAIAKNITKIRTLGDRIDIGKYSDIDLSNWDVSHADSMYRAFSNANVFNQYIGNWDVSDVTDMQYMFSNANAFNQYIGNWDVSKDIANIPTANILIKYMCPTKHRTHNSYCANKCAVEWRITSSPSSSLSVIIDKVLLCIGSLLLHECCKCCLFYCICCGFGINISYSPINTLLD